MHCREKDLCDIQRATMGMDAIYEAEGLQVPAPTFQLYCRIVVCKLSVIYFARQTCCHRSCTVHFALIHAWVELNMSRVCAQAVCPGEGMAPRL